jgi:hypothetical protein
MIASDTCLSYAGQDLHCSPCKALDGIRCVEPTRHRIGVKFGLHHMTVFDCDFLGRCCSAVLAPLTRAIVGDNAARIASCVRIAGE